MKNTNHFKKHFNLTSENRLVYAVSRGPSETPQMPDAERALQATLNTEIDRTRAKLSTLREELKNLNEERAKQIETRLGEISTRLEKTLERRREANEALTMDTLDKINTNIDKTAGRYRIRIMRNILEGSKNDIRQGNVSSLVTVFTLLKSDDVPVKVGDLAINRRGHNLIVEDGSGDDKVRLVLEMQVNNGRWEVSRDGETLLTAPKRPDRSEDPLAGLEAMQRINPDELYLGDQPVTGTEIERMIAEGLGETPAEQAESTPEETETAPGPEQLAIMFNRLHQNQGEMPSPLVESLNKIGPTDNPIKLETTATVGNEQRAQTTYISCSEQDGKKYYRVSIQQDHPNGVKTSTVHFYPQDTPRTIYFRGADPVYENWTLADSEGQLRETPDDIERRNIEGCNALVKAIILDPEADIDDILKTHPNIVHSPEELFNVYKITPPFTSPVYTDRSGLNKFRMNFTADTLTIETLAPGEIHFHKTYQKTGSEKMKKFARPEAQTTDEFLRAEGIIPEKKETPEHIRLWVENLKQEVDALVKKFGSRAGLEELQRELSKGIDMQGKSVEERRQIYEQNADTAVRFGQRLADLQRLLGESSPDYPAIKKQAEHTLAILPSEDLKNTYASLLREPEVPEQQVAEAAPESEETTS